MGMQLASRLTLAKFRQLNAANLPHTALVQVAVTTPAAGGRESVTSHTTLYTLACRLSLAGTAERERLVAGGIEAPTAYVVAFEAGVNIQLQHQLVVTGVTQTPLGDVAFSHTLQIVLIDPQDRAGEFLRKVVAVP